ncbi:MAG: hypothetical protein PHS41_05555 [Victivallaceae bacterium]|nr:hypothetical protein [Victivallaceae bacterium]
MNQYLLHDICATEERIETFLDRSGFVGKGGVLNDSCYPDAKYFTHESYAASPRFPHRNWYCREHDGGNPNAMTYGFAIGEFVRRFRKSGDERFLRTAEKLADHILKFQILDRKRRTWGGFGSGELLNDSAHQLPYALLRLAECSQTGANRYRDRALLCLDHFILGHHCQCDASGEPTGVFYDFFSEERNRFESWGEPQRCAHSPLCFAFSLFAGYAATKDKRYLTAVRRSYDWLLREYHGEILSSANGIEIAPEGEGDHVLGFGARQVVPRYTGYLIHTLLGTCFFCGGEEIYLREAVRCGELILDAQRPDGTFPITREIEEFFPNTTNGAYGYLGGTFHLLALATGERKFERAAERAVRALRLDQCKNPAMDQFGGILRKGGASVLEGMIHPFGYNWVVDGFQTLLNQQGIHLLLEQDSFLGGSEDISGFFAYLRNLKHNRRRIGTAEQEDLK